MKPSFRQIADLFGIPIPEHASEPSDDIVTVKGRLGRTAEESRAFGNMLMLEGKTELAIEHFRRAVEQEGEQSLAAKLDLGGAYEYVDMMPQALRQYRAALKVHADSVDPYVALSDFYKRHGRMRSAIGRIEEAIRLQPKNAFLHSKLAEDLREIGEREMALIAIQGAVSVAPEDAFYHFWMGDLLIELGRFAEALDALRAAIELSPGDDHYYLRAAVAFWSVGKRPEAIRAIRLAADLEPDKPSYQGILAELLERTGQHDEAAIIRKTPLDRYDREVVRRFLEEIGRAAAATATD
ncbi:MAG: tetratricopeptide repeat protein [Fimbriimonadaceae bacterium]|nr:tetratricopeptide repeat protein [Fimbriimonadaceae bacterium]